MRVNDLATGAAKSLQSASRNVTMLLIHESKHNYVYLYVSVGSNICARDVCKYFSQRRLLMLRRDGNNADRRNEEGCKPPPTYI